MHLRHALGRITLGVALATEGEGVVRGEGGLPVAFRLFKAGQNETTKGVFLFDAKAAESVMACAADRQGVEYPIDLEHLALDQESRAYDPDARGWFSLDVRQGELWAVNVRWTSDGARRLSEKTQRYISPAFCVDEDNRVTEIVNVALVAMPATQGAPALVAANRKTMSAPKAIADLTARLMIGRSKIKLAEGDAPAPDAAPADGAESPGKFASAQDKADALEAAIADFKKAVGGDPDALFAAMSAAVKAASDFEAAVAAVTGAPAEAEPPTEQMSAPPTNPDEDPRKMSRIERENVRLRAALAAERHEKEVARLAAESTRRTNAETKLNGRQITIVPAVMAVLTKHLPVDALELLEASASATPVALGGPVAPKSGTTDDGSREFVTRYGTVTLSANQLRECERFGSKPEDVAEIQARRLHPVKR